MGIKIIELPSCPICGCNRCDCGAKEYHAKVCELQEKIKAKDEALEHIIEYWNQDRNDEAMHDALWHIIETAEQALK
jgi:hypothetical protein